MLHEGAPKFPLATWRMFYIMEEEWNLLISFNFFYYFGDQVFFFCKFFLLNVYKTKPIGHTQADKVKQEDIKNKQNKTINYSLGNQDVGFEYSSLV